MSESESEREREREAKSEREVSLFFWGGCVMRTLCFLGSVLCEQ